MLSKRQAREMLSLLENDPEKLREFLAEISETVASRTNRMREKLINQKLSELSALVGHPVLREALDEKKAS